MIINKALLRLLVRTWDFRQVRRTLRPLWKEKKARQWVFLVGCYNSGTTIARELIGSHPDVRILPREGARLTGGLPRPEDLGWTRMWINCPEYLDMSDSGADVVDEIVKDWSPWWGKGGDVFLEKSITNVTRMQWLDAHFPNSYFIGITRNGYCVAEGIRRKARPGARVRREVGKSYPIEMAGRQWVDSNERLLNGASAVRNYLGISYEQLVQEPIVQLSRIWDYLGLDKPSMSISHGGMLNINGKEFDLRNDNERSIDRLGGEDVERLNRIIGEMQSTLGYPIIEPAAIGE